MRRTVGMVAATCGVLFGACASAPAEREYLVTVTPLASIVAELTAGRAAVRALLPAGGSPHTYDPRPSDARRAAAALALLHVAPTLDAWATRLDARQHLEVLPWLPEALAVQLPVGAHDDAESDGHEHGAGVDPHFWTDPLAVRALLPRLVEVLCAADAAGCAQYRANGEAFGTKLGALHEATVAALEPLRGARLVLAHPFLLYYMRRYGLELVAVAEAAPGKEPTPRFVQELVRVARERQATAVVVQPQLPHRAAQLVAEAARLPLVSVDPLGSGASYEELVRALTQELVRALAPGVEEGAR